MMTLLIKCMLNKHKDAFAWSCEDLKKAFSLQKHVINLIQGTIPLISLPLKKSKAEND